MEGNLEIKFANGSVIKEIKCNGNTIRGGSEKYIMFFGSDEEENKNSSIGKGIHKKEDLTD